MRNAHLLKQSWLADFAAGWRSGEVPSSERRRLALHILFTFCGPEGLRRLPSAREQIRAVPLDIARRPAMLDGGFSGSSPPRCLPVGGVSWELFETLARFFLVGRAEWQPACGVRVTPTRGLNMALFRGRHSPINRLSQADTPAHGPGPRGVPERGRRGPRSALGRPPLLFRRAAETRFPVLGNHRKEGHRCHRFRFASDGLLHGPA